jgi:hypothetical protein
LGGRGKSSSGCGEGGRDGELHDEFEDVVVSWGMKRDKIMRAFLNLIG